MNYGDSFLLKIVTPERLLYSDVTNMAVVPGTEGDFGILPGHIPFISSLKSGVVKIYTGDKVKKEVFVDGGFVQVSDNRTMVLAEFATDLKDVNIQSTKANLTELKKKLESSKDTSYDITLKDKILRHEHLLEYLEFEEAKS